MQSLVHVTGGGLLGSHRYSWSSWWLYAESKLSTNQYTRYGTSSSTCSTPLVVDKLQVVGSTIRGGYNGRYHSFPLKVGINKTKYNTTGFTAKDSGWAANLPWDSSIDTPCGAIVDHKATHDGVNGQVRTASGCGR